MDRKEEGGMDCIGYCGAMVEYCSINTYVHTVILM